MFPGGEPAMSFSPSFAGSLEVIVGGMFSGRTEALIARLWRALPAWQKTWIFKPVIDNRHTTHDIISHNTLRLPTVPVSSAEEIVGYLSTGLKLSPRLVFRPYPAL
jgi:thymidine kinase